MSEEGGRKRVSEEGGREGECKRRILQYLVIKEQDN